MEEAPQVSFDELRPPNDPGSWKRPAVRSAEREPGIYVVRADLRIRGLQQGLHISGQFIPIARTLPSQIDTSYCSTFCGIRSSCRF